MIFRLIVTVATVFAVSATPLQRLKRNVQCRFENQFVGGTASDDYHLEVDEQTCLEICQKMDNCTAVNYFPGAKACLPQVENRNEDSSLEFRDEEGTTYIIVKGCQETGQRRKRSVACRHGKLMVGGQVIGNEYILNVTTEQECIEKCKSFENCKSVNYFPKHQACLPYEDSLADEGAEGISTQTYADTVYIILNNCDGSVEAEQPEEVPEGPAEVPGDGPVEVPEEQPEPTRRKREVDDNCKLDDVLVGGSVVNEKYIEDVKTLEACIEECQNLKECNAVNYWAEYGDCLPQRETLASEDKDRLSSREEPGTTYVVVKNCNEKIEKPANILPPVKNDEESGESDESDSSEEGSGESGESNNEDNSSESNENEDTTGLGDPNPDLVPLPEPGLPEVRRKKRDAVQCRQEKKLVGGDLINEPSEKTFETEDDCVQACKDSEKCQAVNYFPDYKVCWLQAESLVSEPALESREDELTNYIIVKGCEQ